MVHYKPMVVYRSDIDAVMGNDVKVLSDDNAVLSLGAGSDTLDS